jgi:hypothetical protein
VSQTNGRRSTRPARMICIAFHMWRSRLAPLH